MNENPLVCSNLPSAKVSYRIDLFLIDPVLLDGREPAWITIHSEADPARAVLGAKQWFADRPGSFREARVVKVVEVVTNETLETLTS